MKAEEKCAECRSGNGSADIKAIVAKYKAFRGNLLPVLHEVQAKRGYLSEPVIDEIAVEMGIPASEIHGTASFYTLFRSELKGEYVIQICDSAPCHIEGSKEIIQAIGDELGIKAGETTSDGKFSLELVSCFGVCGVAPAIMVNEDIYGNLTPEMIPGIIEKYRREEA